jgi:hypothetical protein
MAEKKLDMYSRDISVVLLYRNCAKLNFSRYLFAVGFSFMATITYTWNTFADTRSCKKCLALAGYVWQFKDETPQVLFHPQFGVVYDLAADEPRTHGQGIHNCRCRLLIYVDDSDLTADLDAAISQADGLNNTLRSTLSGVEDFVSLLRSV